MIQHLLSFLTLTRQLFPMLLRRSVHMYFSLFLFPLSISSFSFLSFSPSINQRRWWQVLTGENEEFAAAFWSLPVYQYCHECLRGSRQWCLSAGQKVGGKKKKKFLKNLYSIYELPTHRKYGMDFDNGYLPYTSMNVWCWS